MDTRWSFVNRPAPCAATVAKVFAGLLGIAALAGIYPVASALATGLAVTWKTGKAEPSAAALIVVSAGAAEFAGAARRPFPSPARGMRP
jgi:hypothetical protein